MDKKRIKALPYSDFYMFMLLLTNRIEACLGEPHNPDHMLDESREMTELLQNTQREANKFGLHNASRLDNMEDDAFEALIKSLRDVKKWVLAWASADWFPKLDIPVKMPRSRAKAKEAAHAILLAWDEHSADPELVNVAPAMDELRAANDAYLAAWDAQQIANRTKKDKYRAAQQARARCEKFVSRVKKYLSLYLDPYDPTWGLYGFEEREKKKG